MKRGKRFSFFIFFLLGIMWFWVPVNAEDTYDLIYDDQANLITEESEQKLVQAEMEKIQEECHVIFYTTDESSSKSAEEKCEDYVANLYGSSKSQSAIMFLIDMDNREIYLYCTGPVHTVITSSDALTITDNVYTYATRGEYASCAIHAFDQSYSVANGYRIKRPMKLINNILIALFLGFLCNFIWMKFARYTYIRFFNPYTPSDKKMRSNLKITKDVKHVRTRYYRESSGTSGGGSSGGGFSGGGGGGSSSGSSGGGHSF